MNYTPLDVSHILNEGKVGKMEIAARSRDRFDRIFFPFSFAVLLFALTFYAVKFVSESATNQSITQTPVLNQTSVAAVASPEPTTEMWAMQEIYTTVNDVQIDPLKMRQTAQVQYPNVNAIQLTGIVNRALVEWGALRQYYADKPHLVNPSQLTDTTLPVATFSAILRDLGVMLADYDSRGAAEKPPFTQLVEEFKNNATIR
jgi:hypothetical protein